jgi:DNA primase
MATAHYQKTLKHAADFLTARGIDPETAQKYRLGFVLEPFLETHEAYVGRLSIPYLSRAGVLAVRFRGLGEEDPKYLQPKGSTSWIYNVGALYSSPRVVAVCEGELDALTCHAYAGIPAVGIAGVNAWKKPFARCFESPEKVLLVGDGDAAGQGMVDRLAELLPNAVPAVMPAGHDVNSFYAANGAEALRELLEAKL